MEKQFIAEIKELIATPKHIVIVPHKNPDGDAIGSSLGLYHYLLKYDHSINIIAPNDYPGFLKWMPDEDLILKFDAHRDKCIPILEAAELIFTLDFNALNRTGDLEPYLSKSKASMIMIDHHQQPEDYAKFTYSDVSMSSTCEMVYNFIAFLDDQDKIDQHIATCLYTGIMTDTGSFRFDSTTSQTHRIVADLMDKGAQNSKIHNAVFDTNSYNRMQLLGCALRNLKVIPEFRTAYISLSQEELNTYKFQKGDTEGFVNYALSLEHVVFAAIFIEDQKQGIIKVSLRSSGSFSVNEFSRSHFDGGGHINAAGGKSEMKLDETIEKFISILPSYKNALNHE